MSTNRKSAPIWFSGLAALSFSLVSVAGCGTSDNSTATVPAKQAPKEVLRLWGSAYGTAVGFDEGYDFEGGASVASLEREADVSGVGRLVGVRSDLVFSHNSDEQEHLLVFEVEPEVESGGPQGETVLLVLPGSPVLDVSDLDALMKDRQPIAFYAGYTGTASEDAALRSADGAKVAGQVLRVAPTFPLVMGLTGPDVASSLTSSLVIPATSENFGPLRERGITVESFDSILHD